MSVHVESPRWKPAFLVAATIGCAIALAAPAHAQLTSTAFTYQGRLTDAGTPSDGAFDFRFLLYSADVGGQQSGPTVLLDDVAVVSGLFTVTLDFGPVFVGTVRFLEIAVRPGASTGAYTVLGTRQELKPTPNAVFSQTAPWSGVTNKPIGFADNVDNDLLGSAACANGQVMKATATAGSWACAADIDTSLIYTGANGLQVIGTTISPIYGGTGIVNSPARSDHNHFGHSWTGNGGPLAITNQSNSAFVGVATANAPALLGLSNATSGLSAHGVRGETASVSGSGVYGLASATVGSTFGVRGINTSPSGAGVQGEASATSGAGYGVVGVTQSVTGRGVLGSANATSGVNSGVHGESNSPNGRGVYGLGDATSGSSSGVYAETRSPSGRGVFASALATSGFNFGVYGRTGSPDGHGVFGLSDSTGAGVAILGRAEGSIGVGVSGVSFGNGNAVGVMGSTFGTTASAAGVIGELVNPAVGGAGVWGIQGPSSSAYAGYFTGRTHVNGLLSKAAGSFKIDHPLDPENKYLYHSFVESPDMMNVYNGNVVTDADGFAVVVLPQWFEALNRDYRYQLTVVDGADDAGFVQVKVARKVEGNRFAIRSSAPRTEVSWQVTGIRKDPFAEKNRIPVEEAKPETERGTYLHPDAWGADPATKGYDERRQRMLPRARGRDAAASETSGS